MRFLNRPAFLLLPLMAVGAYLRLKGLTFQSLWLDEIHTMIEAAPTNSIVQVFHRVIGADPHPPFYFLLIHFWFKIFGYGDYIARLLSVIAGIIAIPSIYLLGKDLYSKAAGYLSAVFTTFNYYTIYYSQEARDYMLAFLFTILSFLYFIKTVRDHSWKNGIWYVVFTCLLVYTHYYGLLILCCQMLIGLILILRNKELKRLFIYFGIVLLSYAPWIPVMISVAQKHKSFWIQKPQADFLISYFREYFGRDAWTTYLYLFLLLVFFLMSWLKKNRSEQYKFALFILVAWIAGSYFIPYIKSQFSMPILSPRYTIVTLPAILLAAAVGADFLPRWTNALVAVLVISFSVIYLFDVHQYYSRPTKAQWREMAQFIQKENTKGDPMISDRQWHLNYYFSVFQIQPHYVGQDQINRLNSVWVVTGHWGHPVSQQTKEILDRDFIVRKSFKGISTSAVLYERKPTASFLKKGPLYARNVFT